MKCNYNNFVAGTVNNKVYTENIGSKNKCANETKTNCICFETNYMNELFHYTLEIHFARTVTWESSWLFLKFKRIGYPETLNDCSVTYALKLLICIGSIAGRFACKKSDGFSIRNYS